MARKVIQDHILDFKLSKVKEKTVLLGLKILLKGNRKSCRTFSGEVLFKSWEGNKKWLVKHRNSLML